jgi:hypothetical protein
VVFTAVAAVEAVALMAGVVEAAVAEATTRLAFCPDNLHHPHLARQPHGLYKAGSPRTVRIEEKNVLSSPTLGERAPGRVRPLRSLTAAAHSAVSSRYILGELDSRPVVNA